MEGDNKASARLDASEAEVASLRRCEADLRARLAASEAEIASLRAYTGKRGSVSSPVETAGGSDGEAMACSAGSGGGHVEEGAKGGEEGLGMQLRFAEIQLQATREILVAHDRALGSCPSESPRPCIRSMSKSLVLGPCGSGSLRPRPFDSLPLSKL
jgi:hypothetical protein